MTSSDLKYVPSAKAFAVDGDKNTSIPSTSTTAMNLATGFPSVYSKPLADGGKLIQRKEMNTLFYQLMLFQNFLQNGGYITWNKDVMTGIGGYPNGAVLSLIDSTTGAETRIQSCADNNYLEPTSASIGVKYSVNKSTVPYTYTKNDSGDVIWRYVNERQLFPQTIIHSEAINDAVFWNYADNVEWSNYYTVQNDSFVVCSLNPDTHGSYHDFNVEITPPSCRPFEIVLSVDGGVCNLNRIIYMPMKKGTKIRLRNPSKQEYSRDDRFNYFYEFSLSP